ncbi:MAG TPA: FliM/FliN family flagellar motor switch protein [Novosphingobium sp.]|nr:FliM/FliN family flagellar motor switch protein [Novosphingobium sp.]
MKPERAFTAERIAAQHCPELLQRAAGCEPADLLGDFTRLGDRLARQLAPELARLLGGEEPVVHVSAARELSEGELASELGQLAANSLIASGVPGIALLASIEGSGLLRLVDRAFGGKGDAPAVMPKVFPLSANLMIDRIEALLAAALGGSLGQEGLRVLRRDTSLAELAPFPAGARLALLSCEVAEGARAPWKFAIALPLVSLPRLFGNAAATPREPRSADPASEPFATMPLTLVATLVDMAMPISRLSTLEPGTVLPVAVARSVPITLGSATLARGTVGAQDDRIAIKLTQIA